MQGIRPARKVPTAILAGMLGIMMLSAILPIQVGEGQSVKSGSTILGPNGNSIHVWNATNLNAAVLIPAFHANSTAVITLYNGTRISHGPNDPLIGGSLYSRPYEGAYMSGSKSTATSVKAEISFPNTNPSSIPSGNWLEGTISLQGEESYINNQDYLMRAAYVLYPNGNHGVVADMWKDCEGLPGSPPPNCGGSSATELFAYILVISGLSAGQPIYVAMTVGSPPTTVFWFYSFDGSTWNLLYSFTPPSTMKPYLYLGTASVCPPCLAYPYYTAYEYQFGMWSQSVFSGVPFSVEIQNPQYYQSGAWKTVAQAKTMEGPYTFFDADWTLTNTWWTHAVAGGHQSTAQVTFSYCANCVQLDNFILWG